MKLLELIVKNVKREELPTEYSGFGVFGVHDDKYVCGYKNGANWNVSHLRHIAQLAEVGDFATREDLIRAYDLVEQGYTLWFGGECPVDGYSIVDVELRDYVTSEYNFADKIKWEHNEISEDVIAYKVNVKFKNHDNGEKCKSDSDELIRLISSVAPNITISDTLEITDTLIDAGYRK